MILTAFNTDYTFLIIAGISLVLLLIIYLIKKYVKILSTVSEVFKLVFDYFYVVLIPIPILYLCYYYLFFSNGKPETYIFNSIELIKDLKNLSFWFFTAGVFSAASKLISNLVIFKNQFKKVILSSEFDELLTQKLEVLTFSDENLSRQTNLDEIWRKVTLCKYQKSFPHLMTKLHENLENELFEENNLTCYYKNLRIQANIELLSGDLVKITEISSCTVVTNSKEPVDMTFFVRSEIDDSSDVFTMLDPERTKVDGKQFDSKTFKSLTETTNVGKHVKYYTHKLEGKTEYHIERCIIMQQNLSVDRVYAFASAKIIDDLYIHLQPDKHLDVQFSGVGKNVFKNDNMKVDGQTFVNRDLLMPGEKFKVFIFKK
ncbi:hypothetical protein [Pedobacter sp. Leaf176]|uniref:hypothetical protein n=1 Tax=Pedobacter sp. Leaf176 TaxID=1736286 RepID=UPI0006F8B475|nr:hypothetical protein [Pedobacter sp. Leaf176]KQR72437.1 hypothetical protein ASF92_03910 [Pedobacter sp. Leaf176]